MTTKSTIDEIGARALELSALERASLVGMLVKSLLAPDRDIWKAWLDEAQRRDQEMGEDPEAGVPAQEAFRRAYASLR
jgi:Putative addiction module component